MHMERRSEMDISGEDLDVKLKEFMRRVLLIDKYTSFFFKKDMLREYENVFGESCLDKSDRGIG